MVINSTCFLFNKFLFDNLDGWSLYANCDRILATTPGIRACRELQQWQDGFKETKIASTIVVLLDYKTPYGIL